MVLANIDYHLNGGCMSSSKYVLKKANNKIEGKIKKCKSTGVPFDNMHYSRTFLKHD